MERLMGRCETEDMAEARIGLYIHLAAAIGATTLLTVINLATQTEYLWFKWPLLGLTLSVIFHWLGLTAHPRVAWRLRGVPSEKESGRGR